MSNRTETRDWPVEELAGVTVNPPVGYIGGKIYPVLPVGQKAGKLYYQTLVADSAAQTNRAAGAAPTATIIADANVDFSAGEVLKRYGRDCNAVSLYGGMEAMDKIGSQASMRSVFRAIENLQAAKLITAARYADADDISDIIIDGIGDAADSVKRHAGRLAFVCSMAVYRWIVRQPEIQALMLRSFGDANGGGLTAAQALALKPEVFKAMVSGVFGFDEVLIGDDEHWAISGMEDAAAVVKLPDPVIESHELGAVLGKTALYSPQDGSVFEVRSFYDETLKLNTYDATSWCSVVEFNPAAAVLVKGLAGATT